MQVQVEKPRNLLCVLCSLTSYSLVVCCLSTIACTTSDERVKCIDAATDDIRATSEKGGNLSKDSVGTDAFFFPKVDLHKLRFGFYIRGKLCFDMRDEVDYNRFVAETGFSESNFDYDSGELSREQEDWVLRESTDAVNPEWGVFDPLTYQTETLQFQGITWAGGESASFVCVLGKNRTLSAWDRERDSRAAKVLVFPCSSGLFAHRMHGEEEDIRVLEEISKVVVGQRVGATIQKCYIVYLRYPSTKAYLVFYRVDGNGIMGLISTSGGEYRLSSLRLKRGVAAFGGMLIEHANPNYDTALANTRIAVLPDIDGNGSNEVYVDSTICFLLSVDADSRNQPVLEEIDSYYSGP